MRTTTRSRAAHVQWLIPTGLILLSLIPIAGGAFRLTELSGGPEVLPSAERFTNSPIPVALHIISATVFSVIGAFQFLRATHRGRWHRASGRIVAAAGTIAALSGLWMTVAYPHPVGDGVLLFCLRVVFGSYMAVSLALAILAIRRRSFGAHGAWMMRAYALGVAAGTQAILLIPGSIAFGSTHELSRAVAIGSGWVLNLLVAELIIHRRRGAHHPSLQRP